MSDDYILDAQYKETKAIRVGVTRALLILLPSSIVVTLQPACNYQIDQLVLDLVQQMFELDVLEYIFMFVACSLISILTLLYTYGNFMNDKGEQQIKNLIYISIRILKSRQGDLISLSGSDNKRKQKNVSANENQEDIKANQQMRLSIMKEINYESTLYGLWLVNLVYIFSFIFMSFVVLRFWSTGLQVFYAGNFINQKLLWVNNWFCILDKLSRLSFHFYLMKLIQFLNY
ncbi:UNKNOWN [Stylonychia lemnae]|uniref:Transmembrane protein n=1 Tax=Stylonychia lemnae TaxID=5949 RepID=A0A078AV56_STYLE|nr:UNKNOWN [Stylonychia lemnae]|eukprot:CDW84743.1 UNKNOWN [Stylonychia lemnae]